jgi:hypothetical protein
MQATATKTLIRFTASPDFCGIVADALRVGVLVVAGLRARVQIATLFGVYSHSLRALQRYRSSSPQWGHLSAIS